MFETDNLFPYNLVIVIDNHDQDITEVIIGANLIALTIKQSFSIIISIF
ncbi:MAG: hypothetical protein ACTS8H_00435 [Arsenophonus sp. NC-PE1-MAG3]